MPDQEQWLCLFRGSVHHLDLESQHQLYKAFRELVYRDVRFLTHDHALVEDVIQEAFMKAVKGGPSTRSDSNMKAWLRKVARNSAYDLLRKVKRFRQKEEEPFVYWNEELEPAAGEEQQVEFIVERVIRDETIQESIQELKPEYRAVLLLHYIHEFSYAEIERELGISRQILTQRLARARKKLAGILASKWGDSL